MTTKIDVRFATPLPVAVEIRRRGALLERNPGPVRVPLYLVAQWRRFSEEP